MTEAHVGEQLAQSCRETLMAGSRTGDLLSHESNGKNEWTHPPLG